MKTLIRIYGFNFAIGIIVMLLFFVLATAINFIRHPTIEDGVVMLFVVVMTARIIFRE